jgi:hypothetical protein
MAFSCPFITYCQAIKKDCAFICKNENDTKSVTFLLT